MTNEPIVILGAGSTGEALVSAIRAHEPDTPITIVERGLAGGECSYFACMPTKGLLRPPEAVAAARNVPGAAEAVTGPVDAGRLFWHRDQIVNGLDDTSQAEWLASNDAELVRGEARVAGPGVVAVGDRELPFGRLAVATGSSASIPPIPGLDDVEYWTNREATQIHEIPESIAIVGAGPVGCEFAQFFRRMGAAGRRSSTSPTGCCRAWTRRPAGCSPTRSSRRAWRCTWAAGSTMWSPAWWPSRDGAVIHAERLLIATGRHAEHRRPRARAAGRRDLEARRRGRRADARGAGRVGDGRRHRHRDVHPRRQVPRPRRRRRHGRQAGEGRPPRGAGGHVHRPAGGDGGDDDRRRPGLGQPPGRPAVADVDLRATEAAGAAEGVRRPRTAAC